MSASIPTLDTNLSRDFLLSVWTLCRMFLMVFHLFSSSKHLNFPCVLRNGYMLRGRLFLPKLFLESNQWPKELRKKSNVAAPREYLTSSFYKDNYSMCLNGTSGNIY